MTEPRPAVSLDEARAVIAEAEAAQRAEAEAAQQAAAAEHERRTERRRRWAAAYLPGAQAELSAAIDAARQAETAFRDALRAEPWVQALMRWQEARNAAPAAATRASYARHALGISAEINEQGPQPMVTYLNAQPSLAEFWRALDAILQSVPYAPMAAIEAAFDGPDDPLTADA